MQRKKLEELDLLDNFMFGTMVSYPEIGERFSRMLLEIILQKKFSHLKVHPQRVYYGADTNLHGTRLDVFIEEEESAAEDSKKDTENAAEKKAVATVYDVEPDKNSDKESVENLPKRVRFYHSKIDARSLKAGESYRSLKNVFTIMITSYDPFGLGRMVYTIKNGCIEEPNMPYEDGARTIFLYTKGTQGNPPEELKQFLRYMEETRKENVVNNSLQEIHHMVEQVRHDTEVSVEFMRLMEDEEVLLRRGKEEGRAEGKAEDILELLMECGPVPAELKQKIFNETDMTLLKKWLKLSAKVSTIQEFQEQM